MKAETRFIQQVQKMANDVEFQNRHIKDVKKDFKRTRKLTFSDVIMYTIGNRRSPLELEAQRFSKHLKTDEISGAALCKARCRLTREIQKSAKRLNRLEWSRKKRKVPKIRCFSD